MTTIRHRIHARCLPVLNCRQSMEGRMDSEHEANRSGQSARQFLHRGERVSITGSCSYEMNEPLAEDSTVIHQGEALLMNISSGGMLLLMEHAPAVEQVLEVRLPTSIKVATTPTLVEARWRREIPIGSFGRRYLVGVRFLIGSNPLE